MAITYRSEKGAPLTVEEMDGNFRFIEDKLEHHEGLISHSSAVSSVEQEEGVLVFKDPAGEELYRLKMPIPHFSFAGEWEPGKEYVYGNLVSKHGDKYACISSHLATDWESEIENWLCISTQFASGIDSSTDTASGAADAASGAGDVSTIPAANIPKLPIFPVDDLPPSQLGAFIIVALREAPDFVLGLGTPRGWINITTHEPLV